MCVLCPFHVLCAAHDRERTGSQHKHIADSIKVSSRTETVIALEDFSVLRRFAVRVRVRFCRDFVAPDAKSAFPRPNFPTRAFSFTKQQVGGTVRGKRNRT